MKLLFFLLSLLFFSSVWAKPLKPISVQLLWMDQFEFAGLYMAKEKGFYRHAGLDVTLKPFKQGVNISEDVAVGRTTYGIGYSSIIIERAKSLPIVAIGSMFQHSPLAIAVSKNSGINKIADLKNKKIMVTKNHTQDASILAMLTSQELKESDFHLISHSYDISDLINGNTDAMLIYTTNEPFAIRERGIDTLIFNPKDYGYDFYGDIVYTSQMQLQNHPKQTAAFYEATMRGWAYAFEHIDETIKVIHEKYNSQRKSTTALKFEANELKKVSGYGTPYFGKLNTQKLNAIQSVYQTMNMMPQNADMTHFAWHRSLVDENTLSLNPAEKLYLAQKKQIKMCIHPDAMPLDSRYNNLHTGLSADYTQLFSKALNTPIVLIPTATWFQSLDYIKTGKCDMIPLIESSKEREKFLLFTQPYLDEPIVFSTRKNGVFISDIQDIGSNKIGIADNDALIETVHVLYPSLALLPVSNIDEGLKKVKSGELIAYIDTLSLTNYAIQHSYFDELAIGGKLDSNIEFRVGVRSDEPILLNLFEKAITALSVKERESINNHWLGAQYTKAASFQYYWWIIFAALGLFAGLYVWNKFFNSSYPFTAAKSVVDPLSGLYNRRYLNSNFDHIFSQIIKDHPHFFLILIDLDHFKLYHDSQGYQQGDHVVIKLAQILQKKVYDHEIALRLSNEEFALMGGASTIEEALNRAEQIRMNVESLNISHPQNPPHGIITVSAGVVIVSNNLENVSFELLYHQADMALFNAKQQGRNKISRLIHE